MLFNIFLTIFDSYLYDKYSKNNLNFKFICQTFLDRLQADMIGFLCVDTINQRDSLGFCMRWFFYLRDLTISGIGILEKITLTIMLRLTLNLFPFCIQWCQIIFITMKFPARTRSDPIIPRYYLIQPKMKVLRSLNDSSYLVTGCFWSPYILSAELFDQLISFVFADTPPPPPPPPPPSTSASENNAILIQKLRKSAGFWILQNWIVHCYCSKSLGLLIFLIIDYKMAY